MFLVSANIYQFSNLVPVKKIVFDPCKYITFCFWSLLFCFSPGKFVHVGISPYNEYSYVEYLILVSPIWAT